MKLNDPSSLLPLALAGLQLFGGACSNPSSPTSSPSPSPRSAESSNHVFVLVLENRSASQALQHMPYLSQLSQQNSTSTEFFSASHGSWLAYGELAGGIAPKNQTAFGGECNGNGCRSTLNVPNMVRQIRADGKSWKGYFQSIPAVGYMGSSSGAYVRRHNPFPFFSDVEDYASERNNMMEVAQLPIDLEAGQVADYTLIVPDLLHDGHSPANASIALAAADTYLESLIPQILSSKYFQPGGDGVLFITFDESDVGGGGQRRDNRCGTVPETNTCGGQILTAVIGPNVLKQFTSSIRHTHADILRTTCDLLDLSACPGDGAEATGMSEFFVSSPAAN